MERRILTPWDSSRPPEPCEAILLDRSGALYSGVEHGLSALARNAMYFASCPESFLARRDFTSDEAGVASDDSVSLDGPLVDSGPGFSDLRDPFYASTFPVFYVLAATTVIAHMLVIMLFITPRSFVNGGIVYLGRRNRFTSTSSSAVDIGGRPWLQKVAALTVAISLTIATGASFRVMANQYAWGVQNAFLLQTEVMDSTALKIIRLISDTFLWLAQAQTLIRLFQRQREKVIIKWAAFALITLDVIFSALNSFQYTNSGSQGNMRPRTFVQAVPALSYLFQLSLGLLYAAWVIYYSILKKRYAFYHPLMKNMPLVAVISLLSILIPVVFFILDISKPELTGWGDYVRWVGAAAASVVVWEWVERIEALEREEKKDGILGRQVFDGDDMMEVTGSSASSWSRFRKDDFDGSGGNGTRDWSVYGGPFASGRGSVRASLAYRSRPGGSQGRTDSFEDGDRGNVEPLRPPTWPGQTATPVSRTDTGSAGSTVYTVRYQNQSDSTGRTPDPGANMITLSRENSLELSSSTPRPEDGERQASTSTQDPLPTNLRRQDSRNSSDTEASSTNPQEGRWRGLAGIFRRGPQPPPAAVLPHHRRDAPRPEARQRDELGKWDFRARLEDFAVTRAEKLRERMRPTADTEQLRTMVIPAPPRRGAALQELLEQEGLNGSVSGESERDPEHAAPPMWPGVYPIFAESSRSSFDSGEEEAEEERAGGEQEERSSR